MDSKYKYELKPAYSLLSDNSDFGWKFNDMIKAFEISKNDLDGCQFIHAEYNQGNYECDAFIIFIKDSSLYEVNASHCSCNGFEGTWEPEKTTLNALLLRPNVPNIAKEKLRNMVIEKVVQ